MDKFLNLISAEMAGAFEAAGYDSGLGKVTVSNRPDLCEYQCNGAMAGAKRYHKAPIMIASDVAERLRDSAVFSSVEAVKPGFLNLKIREDFITSYLNEMSGEEKFGLETPEKPASIILDYGGPNVAKPLHVGHLRSAVIGEAVKRIARYHGENVIGDIHLGDWGLQMGLVITEVSKRQPDLCYFDPTYEGEYPKEAPFTVSELEEIYPTASKKSKEDPEYASRRTRIPLMRIVRMPAYEQSQDGAELPEGGLPTSPTEPWLWMWPGKAIPRRSLPASFSNPTVRLCIRPQIWQRSARENGSIIPIRSSTSQTSARSCTSSRYSAPPENAA